MRKPLVFSIFHNRHKSKGKYFIFGMSFGKCLYFEKPVSVFFEVNDILETVPLNETQKDDKPGEAKKRVRREVEDFLEVMAEYADENGLMVNVFDSEFNKLTTKTLGSMEDALGFFKELEDYQPPSRKGKLDFNDQISFMADLVMDDSAFILASSPEKFGDFDWWKLPVPVISFEELRIADFQEGFLDGTELAHKLSEKLIQDVPKLIQEEKLETITTTTTTSTTTSTTTTTTTTTTTLPEDTCVQDLYILYVIDTQMFAEDKTNDFVKHLMLEASKYQKISANNIKVVCIATNGEMAKELIGPSIKALFPTSNYEFESLIKAKMYSQTSIKLEESLFKPHFKVGLVSWTYFFSNLTLKQSSFLNSDNFNTPIAKNDTLSHIAVLSRMNAKF